MASRLETVAPASQAKARGGWNGETWVAAVLVVLFGMNRDLIGGVPIGLAGAVAFTPLWWGTLARFKGAYLFLGVGAVAIVSGVWLTESTLDHATSGRLTKAILILLGTMLVGVAVLLWARTVTTDVNVAILFGIGMTLGISTGGRFAENPWRFGFSLPLSVLLLAVAWKIGNRWLQAATALALALVSAAAGGRSTFAMLLVAALITAWQASSSRTKGGSRARVVLLIVTLVFAIYQVGQGLILDGYLGEDAQARTEIQVQTSGNLLLGARPELGATMALFASHPAGFGVGTIPTVSDILVAKTGMASLGYDPNNGYVENYLFGNGFVLHSMIGELWAWLGLVGIAFVLLMLWITVASISTLIARRAAPALLSFLAIRMLWNIFFSPVYSSVVLVILTMGLLIPALVTKPPGETVPDPTARRRTDERYPQRSARNRPTSN